MHALNLAMSVVAAQQVSCVLTKSWARPPTSVFVRVAVCVWGRGGVQGCGKRSERFLHFSQRHVEKILGVQLYIQRAAAHQFLINTIQESSAFDDSKRKSLQ